MNHWGIKKDAFKVFHSPTSVSRLGTVLVFGRSELSSAVQLNTCSMEEEEKEEEEEVLEGGECVFLLCVLLV